MGATGVNYDSFGPNIEIIYCVICQNQKIIYIIVIFLYNKLLPASVMKEKDECGRNNSFHI